MLTVSTRDLAHHAAKVTKALAAGQTLQWVSRGRLIARLVPPAKTSPRAKLDWVGRARQAGAINRATRPISESIYQERG